ncbi:MAG: DUF3883 domain-containing protein [Alphaproteobacteria bacterium]
MAGQPIAGTDWTDREIDLIVADYFAMLREQFAGEPFVKAHHNAALREQTGRSRQSIDYKYRNISAVLEELCEPWLSGYLPARNFQRALVNGVERILDKTRPFDLDRKPQLELADGPIIFLEKPPIFTPQPNKLPEHVTRLVRKFDPAARDARNRSLGERGEELTLRSEHARLRAEGRDDLARKVRWVSKEDGDGAGYDILSFDTSGAERFLEVKTTNGHSKTPFYISANEKSFADEASDRFRLFRLYDFANEPKAFKIQPPMEAHLNLETATYKARF